jgi:hypothetical protein
MSDEGRITIRSYRVCFTLERRIHKIDRWRIPVPFGVPLRGLGYAAGAALLMLLLGRLPGIGLAVGAMHPALRFVAAPACIAFVLCRWEIDGRPAHVGLMSMARFHFGPRRLVAFRPVARAETVVRLRDVVVAPDESGPHLRRGTVRGPAPVVLRYPFRARTAGRALHIVHRAGAAQWRGKQVSLEPGQRMVLR